jgi:hypothetical protein
MEETLRRTSGKIPLCNTCNRPYLERGEKIKRR